jgi:hypothetical protein
MEPLGSEGTVLTAEILRRGMERLTQEPSQPQTAFIAPTPEMWRAMSPEQQRLYNEGRLLISRAP